MLREPSIPRTVSVPVALLALWLPSALTACAPTGADSPATPAAGDAAPREVRTAVAQEETWERTLRVTGELSAFEEVTCSTKVSGRLEGLGVDFGARVKAGQSLARIEPREYEIGLARAEAALQAARAQLGLAAEDETDAVDAGNTAIVREARAMHDDARQERDRLAPLLDQGIVDASAFESAEARFRVTESRLHAALQEVETRRAVLAERRAELEAARQALNDTRIIAPFDGAVSERLAGTGDYLSEGAPIVRLVRFDPVRVRLAVPERDAPAVHAGQTARISIEGGVAPVVGELARIGPEITSRGRTLQVELELENPTGALRPGSFVRGEIVLDAEARTLAVPRAALVRFAGLDKVVAAVDGVAVEKPVTVGRAEGERVEILAGIEPGTEVVLDPGNLQNGMRVTVVQ